MMGYFIELLTEAHEWKLSALVATEDNHKFVKKTIPSIETNITASVREVTSNTCIRDKT